jgi:hypothetical protein
MPAKSENPTLEIETRCCLSDWSFFHMADTSAVRILDTPPGLLVNSCFDGNCSTRVVPGGFEAVL